MYYSSLLVAAAAMTSSVLAQSSAPFNPGTIQSSVRGDWCIAQRNTCPEVCNGTGTTTNNCDPDQLTYTCVCSSGATPNITDYAQTIPAFVCQATQDQCVAATNDAAAQADCRDTQCGTKNASTLTMTSTSTSSSAMTSATGGSGDMSTTSEASATGSPTGSATPAASSGAAAAMAVAREYGTPALMAGMLAVFGLAV